MLGPDRARVGQRECRPGVVLDGELSRPRPPDDVLIGHPELAEVHGLGGLDAGHEQLPCAVAADDVDRQAEVDVLGPGRGGLAVHLGVGVVHLRGAAQSLDDGITDEVGERDLATPATAEVVVDDDAVVDEQLGGNGAHAGRGRHGQAGGHVRRRPGRRSPQPLDIRPGDQRRRGRGGQDPGAALLRRAGPVRRRPAGWPGPAPGACAPAPAGAGSSAAPGQRPHPGRAVAAWSGGTRCTCVPGRRLGRGFARLGRPGSPQLGHPGWPRPATCRRLVIGEEAPPRHVHRTRVIQVALVELIHEPLIGTEVGARWRRRLRPGAVTGWLGGFRGCSRQLRRHGGHRPLPTLNR